MEFKIIGICFKSESICQICVFLISSLLWKIWKFFRYPRNCILICWKAPWWKVSFLFETLRCNEIMKLWQTIHQSFLDRLKYRSVQFIVRISFFPYTGNTYVQSIESMFDNLHFNILYNTHCLPFFEFSSSYSNFKYEPSSWNKIWVFLAQNFVGSPVKIFAVVIFWD